MPGEKLYEELLANDQQTLTTYLNKIMIAKVAEFNKAEVKEIIEGICATTNQIDNIEIVNLLKN